MHTLKSDIKKIKVLKEKLYLFLKDLNNLKKIVPSDKISDWKSTKETCSFNINGLAKIGLKSENNNNPNLVIMNSCGENPFPFSFTFFINSKENYTDCQIILKGEMSSMTHMFVKKPLTNFLNILVNELSNIH